MQNLQSRLLYLQRFVGKKTAFNLFTVIVRQFFAVKSTDIFTVAANKMIRLRTNTEE